MDELPDRAIILEPAPGEFGHQPAQGEVSIFDPPKQPQAVFARNLFRLMPPILPGATLPVSRWRFTQLMAVLIPTPNRLAARLHDIPPLTTAATTRFRRSIE
jgi:hypothetical protein